MRRRRNGARGRRRPKASGTHLSCRGYGRDKSAPRTRRLRRQGPTSLPYPIVQRSQRSAWLERESRRELKRTRAARAEHATGRCNRRPEAGGPQEARRVRVVAIAHQRRCKAGVIHLPEAQHVRDIEQVEHLDRQVRDLSFSPAEDSGNAKVERIEAVVELRVAAAPTEGATVDPAAMFTCSIKRSIPSRCETGGRPRCAENRDPGAGVRKKDVHRHAGCQRPDRSKLKVAGQLKDSRKSEAMALVVWSSPVLQLEIRRIDRARGKRNLIVVGVVEGAR